jgi:tetratricopeptide (TPR) repeat protein
MSSSPSLLERGHAARLAGRFTVAARHYAAARARAVTPIERADALAGSAMTERGLCNYRVAIRLFDRALAIYRASNDREGVAFCLYGRGGARRFLGDFKTARLDLVASLALAPDAEAEIFTRMALGGLLRMIGDLDASLAHYREARRQAGRRRDQYAMAYADCGIGNAWRLIGDRRLARRHLLMAERRYRAIGDRVSRPYTLFALFMMDLEEGRAGRFSEMDRLFRATRDRRGLVYASLARAVRHGLRGENVVAARIARKAFVAARGLGLKLEAMYARLLIASPGDRTIRAGYRRLGAALPKKAVAIP